MVRPNRRTTWLPLAIAAAIAVTNPFLMVGAGGALGLLVLCCDNRLRWRQLAALSLVPIVAFGIWYNPLLALFAAASALVAVYCLKGNYFSSVTSSALVGCAAGAALTAVAVTSGAWESWAQLESSVLESQQMLQQMASDSAAGDVEQEIAWQEMNLLVVRLMPGQFGLMMVAGFFLAVIVFRRYGRSKFHLSLGISSFIQYRFEDNWIWAVVAGLAGGVLAGGSELILRLSLNLLFVMGVLYVIRGLSVIFHFVLQRKGGIFLRLLTIVLCFTPLVMIHLALGLLDTWIDFRRNVSQA
ncbi:MAG: DUF2232 domain-containing protein [Candidatus Glassbacteria bacterium]|nr:DUF2232 domain-containing protein [Candidatus Glassbacteria bacterium]